LLRGQRSAGLRSAPRAIETPARELNPWRRNSRKEDMKVAIDTKIHCELTVSASLLETARIASVRRVRHFERFSLFIQTTYTACRPDHASVGHNRRTALWGKYDADPVEICPVQFLGRWKQLYCFCVCLPRPDDWSTARHGTKARKQMLM